MKKLFITALLAAAWGTSASAATLIVNDGKLSGATGVEVNGSLFDVTFADGTCSELFNGCDEPSDFVAIDFNGARQALLDQVFIDTAAGAFDSNPGLTVGCSDALVCSIIVPISASGADFTGARALNTDGPDFADGGMLRGPRQFDFTTSDGTRTFAVFSVSQASAVPEPATWAMMLIGFGAVGYSMRERSSRQFKLA